MHSEAMIPRMLVMSNGLCGLNRILSALLRESSRHRLGNLPTAILQTVFAKCAVLGQEEALFDELRNQIVRAYPNPDRMGCPDESVTPQSGVRANHAIMEHAHTCGPCTRQVSIFVKEKARRRPAPEELVWFLIWPCASGLWPLQGYCGRTRFSLRRPPLPTNGIGGRFRVAHKRKPSNDAYNVGQERHGTSWASITPTMFQFSKVSRVN